MNVEPLPHQIKSMIDSMLNDTDNVYIRTNYRDRLSNIKTEIERAMSKFDMELNMADVSRQRKKK